MASVHRKPGSVEDPDHVYSVLETDGATQEVEEVSASWRRSLIEYHLDPASRQAPQILTGVELKDARTPLEDLVEAARDENDRLYGIVGKAGYVVLLTSSSGVVVDARGDPSRVDEFTYWGVWKGGVWSEAAEGTNGIGTCIAEQRPVTVHRSQHFRARHGTLSCCGAPVFDPRGNLLAVLDVSSVDPDLSDKSHALALSVTMNSAHAIEEKLFLTAFTRAWIVRVSAGAMPGETYMLAVDDDQRILGADRNARSILGLDNERLSSGASLWSFFDRSPSIFLAAGTGGEVQLTREGHTGPWRALITPPAHSSLARPARTSVARPTKHRHSSLSPRERNILELIGEGRSNKEIARALDISPETVKSHIKNMFAKLGVERRAEAVYRLRDDV